MNQEQSLRAQIHHALDVVAEPTPALLPGIAQRLRRAQPRRPVVAVGQLAAALTIALVVAAVAFSMHRSRVATGHVTTSPTNPIMAGAGADVAWVTSQTNSGDVVTGIDPAGHVVGRIDAPAELRSRDGAHLYALTNGGLEIFSAADGHRERTIPLKPVAPGLPMLSADGSYLAVSGGSPAMLQLIDLSKGSVVSLTDAGLPTYGVPVIVGSQAEHIYLMGESAITKLAFDGTTLRVEQRSPGKGLPCNGLSVGGVNSGGGLPFRVLADDRTLVAFCPADGRVTWFDLVRMNVSHEIVVQQENPFWVTPVFSPDGNTLYLHEGGTGALHVVDLVHQTAGKSTKVATADKNPLAWLGSLLVTPAYAGGIPRTAALSPDSTWLYAVGAFGAQGGVSLVHLPDLTVKGRWLPDVSLDSVWASADGGTVYVLGSTGTEVRVLRTDGSQVARLALPSNTYGFIVPSIP